MVKSLNFLAVLVFYFFMLTDYDFNYIKSTELTEARYNLGIPAKAES